MMGRFVIVMACTFLLLRALVFGPVSVGGEAPSPAEAGVMLSDFDDTVRPWTAESGPTRNVRVTDREKHTGGHVLAIRIGTSDGGRILR